MTWNTPLVTLDQLWSCISSPFFVLPQPNCWSRQSWEKRRPRCKHCSATPKTLVCYQLLLMTNSKPEPVQTAIKKIISIPARLTMRYSVHKNSNSPQLFCNFLSLSIVKINIPTESSFCFCALLSVRDLHLDCVNGSSLKYSSSDSFLLTMSAQAFQMCLLKITHLSVCTVEILICTSERSSCFLSQVHLVGNCLTSSVLSLTISDYSSSP